MILWTLVFSQYQHVTHGQTARQTVAKSCFSVDECDKN